MSITANDNFEETILNLLNLLSHAYLTEKILRHNNDSLLNKNFGRKLLKDRNTKNNPNKFKNYENWSLYKKQRNQCLTLLRKTKKT